MCHMSLHHELCAFPDCYFLSLGVIGSVLQASSLKKRPAKVPYSFLGPLMPTSTSVLWSPIKGNNWNQQIQPADIQ